MNKNRKLAIALLALAALSGCATTRTAERQGNDQAAATAAASAPAQQQVLRATQSYGSLGGYRYRRFVVVSVPLS